MAVEPVTISAADFTQRVDLDNYVRNELGENIDTNREARHTIEGTAEQLILLGLSTSTRVYGVKVVEI